MQVPKEFTQLCIAFYPRSDEQYATSDDWISGTVRRFLDDHARKVVKVFLDELLSGRYSDVEIERIWLGTNPSWRFDPGSTRMFLTKVRRELN